MTLPTAIMHVLATMALLCNLSLAPVLPPWEPDPADVALAVLSEAVGAFLLWKGGVIKVR